MKSDLSKTKIINDPVYGFIKIPSNLVYELINHAMFQRLRRIKQLGLTYYVYPGANHTRFQHAIGAAYLMDQAISNLKIKGLQITDEEAEASLLAILLHDIGHGPFSHALEESIIEDINHEDISLILMEQLNKELKGKLDLTIKIFNDQYKKRFLHQLVSSQLDMDRLDYLKRDSFFTGVTEGAIGTDRIIKMLNVIDDNLVVESKGIYSVENFLISRRLMYWQVYFHKTVIAAEYLLVKLLKRAKELSDAGTDIFSTPSLSFFLKERITKEDFYKNSETTIQKFIALDDDDIMVSAKNWISHPDRILSTLSGNLINRVLPKVKLQNQPFEDIFIDKIREEIIHTMNFTPSESEYLVYSEIISNDAYTGSDDKIRILYSNGELEDIVNASDIFNVDVLLKTEKKYFLSYPKNCGV